MSKLIEKIALASSFCRSYCIENSMEIALILSAIKSADERAKLEQTKTGRKPSRLTKAFRYTVTQTTTERFTVEQAEIALRFSAFDDAMEKVESLHGSIETPSMPVIYKTWLTKFKRNDANKVSPNAVKIDKPKPKRNGKRNGKVETTPVSEQTVEVNKA